MDLNHHEIVEALEKAGAEVENLAGVGGGCPDILVAFRGVWYLAEIKKRKGSHIELSESQQRWHKRFGEKATIYIWRGPIEALRDIGAI